MARTLSIWLEDGRGSVCHPVDEDSYFNKSRTGLRCKVVTTDGDKGFSHVYYDGGTFNNGCERGTASVFYQKGVWWKSYIHIKGWSFTFTPPRAKVLKQELTVLATRILEINKELDTLR
jgi:hypothetical protein